MLDQQSPQLFHRFKQLLPRLLDQNLSEDGAKRAYVAPERVIFRRLIGMCREFGEPGLLVVGSPQRFGFVCGHQQGIRQNNRRAESA
jgi:hypothetical protein